ncbi:MAG TPA: helix-turn-helix domain-containing protein [Thermomicrobiales bacterium]|jgi:TetR/AcrR family fatty acid metabolism transcriptional regulator
MTDAIQQQLIVARKSQILDAAAAVFVEKGFHATTTREIARRAGIAEGTIYNYFDSKPSLLLGIFERMRASVMQQAPLPIPSDLDPHTFIRTLLQHPLAAQQGDDFALFRIVVSEMMVNEELRTRYREQILAPTLLAGEAALRGWAVGRGLSPTMAALTIRAISGMVLGLIMQRIMGDATVVERWEELPDVLAALLVQGLGGDDQSRAAPPTA